MTAIAAAAGITRRGLYLHFSSRAELLIAVIHRRNEVLDLAGSIRPIYEAPDALAALNEWVRHLTHYHSQIRPVVDAVDRARATDADAAAMWEEAMKGWQGACSVLAEWLERDGKLAPGWTAAAAADALWALMVAFTSLWRALVEERGWSREQFREFLARLHFATFVA